MVKKLLPNCLLLAMALVYTACKKENAGSQNSGGGDVVNTAPYSINMPGPDDQNSVMSVSLKVDGTTTGMPVPDDFLGFSFEKQIVTDTTYFNASNTSFINMFKNLETGLIRIGGSTVDRTFWSNSRRKTSTTDSVYANDVSRYKAFAQSVGWKTIWGLNLGTGTPASDADEANYVSANIGDQVASFAIGNEPSYLYVSGLRPMSYNSTQYLGEFNNFSSAVKASVPNAAFSGPDNEDTGWGLSFMQSASLGINMLTVHYYRMGPAGSPLVTMNQLLTFDSNLRNLASDAGNATQGLQTPYRVTECNSVYGGGEPNMSNAYAASLWGSEFLFYLAQQGAGGINFHTGGTPNYVYSPISTVNGKSVARPLYYSMLLFHQANIRQFTNNEVGYNSLNMDTYSFITKDNKKGIMIINKEASNDISMTINTGALIQTATVYELNGPSLDSLTGTNINGAVVNDDGTFSGGGISFDLAKKYSTVIAKVKPISAMLIVLD
jgi:hypothetical protein